MPPLRDPSAGWRVEDVKEFTILENDSFLGSLMKRRVQGIHSHVCDRLDRGIAMKRLPTNRAGVFSLLSDPVVHYLLEFANEILPADNQLSFMEFHRFIATMLLISLQRTSVQRRVETQQRLGRSVMDHSRLIQVLKSLRAYSTMDREASCDGEWNDQYDTTPLFRDLEKAALGQSAKFLFSPTHTLLTEDDEMVQSRAKDVQVLISTLCFT